MKNISLVKLKDFYISDTPITEYQYAAMSGLVKLPTRDHPVTNVSWHDAVNFCRFLSTPKKKFRLPTSEEWEYACRANTNTIFNTGDFLSTDEANFNGQYPYCNNSFITKGGAFIGNTTEVGSYEPNKWGLYDMHGNVGEWCSDWYDDKKEYKVIKGGSWLGYSNTCASAYRGRGRINNLDGTPSKCGIVGFRVVCEV